VGARDPDHRGCRAGRWVRDDLVRRRRRRRPRGPGAPSAGRTRPSPRAGSRSARSPRRSACLTPSAYRQETLNLWATGGDEWLPPGTWLARIGPQPELAGQRVVLGVESAPTWSRASVTVAILTDVGAWGGVAGELDAQLAAKATVRTGGPDAPGRAADRDVAPVGDRVLGGVGVRAVRGGRRGRGPDPDGRARRAARSARRRPSSGRSSSAHGSPTRMTRCSPSRSARPARRRPSRAATGTSRSASRSATSTGSGRSPGRPGRRSPRPTARGSPASLPVARLRDGEPGFPAEWRYTLHTGVAASAGCNGSIAFPPSRAYLPARGASSIACSVAPVQPAQTTSTPRRRSSGRPSPGSTRVSRRACRPSGGA
jgi:hypothetical protein